MKNVGDFPENVGDFSENVGVFSENVGVFCEKFGANGRKVVKYCRRSGECAKASVGRRDEIKESFGQVEGKPYFCREQGSVA